MSDLYMYYPRGMVWLDRDVRTLPGLDTTMPSKIEAEVKRYLMPNDQPRKAIVLTGRAREVFACKRRTSFRCRRDLFDAARQEGMQIAQDNGGPIVIDAPAAHESSFTGGR
jgi:hypothetical protein